MGYVYLMARPLRIEFPGAVYHIISRGNAKQSIFLDESDRRTFLKLLSSVVERFNWLCHAYCLMDNHYHLIIETPDGNLSRGMRQLNGVYTQGFNRRHGRDGHLFQGRYKSILVDKDNFLLSLCRYVILNPVKTGLVKRPENWKWSSYRETIGESKKPSFLTTDWILSQFGEKKSLAIIEYKRFVSEGKDVEYPWEALRGQVFLGNDHFIEKFKKVLKEKEILKEVPRAQRYVTRPGLSELFRAEKLKDKTLKDESMYRAYVRYGYSLKDIAEHLGVHYATVSRAIRRIENYSDARPDPT